MADDSPEIITTDTLTTVRYRGRFLYKGNNPEAGALRRVRALTIEDHTLIVVPSPLLFYGLSELLDILPANCHILCIEVDQQLMAVSTAHIPDAVKKSARITCIRADRSDQIVHVLSSIGIWNFRRALLFPLSGGYSLASGTYRQLFSHIEQLIRSGWQNKITTIHMAGLWFRNIFRNLSVIPNTKILPPRLPEGMPVLITGAGLSLESSISLIRRYRDSFFLLSVDTALPVLKTHDIQPDGVCVMEGQVYNMYDFLGNDKADPVLFADITSYPGTVPLFSGPVHLFISHFTNSRLFFRLKEKSILPWIIPPLGSIGVVAVYIAKQITDGPVIFTGLDFAYTMGKSHAAGAPVHQTLLAQTNRMKPPHFYTQCVDRPRISADFKNIREIDSKAVTDLVLNSYVETLNSVIGEDNRCFDLSSFGLKNNARPVRTDARFQEITSGMNIDSNFEPNSWQTAREKVNQKDIECFLSEELDLLENAIEHGRYFITTRQDKETTKLILDAFSEVDYVYADFPDNPPLPKTDPGFVKRMLVSAQKYREIIRNALGLVRF